MSKHEEMLDDLILLLGDVQGIVELEVLPQDLTIRQYTYIIERLKDIKDTLYLSLSMRTK